MAKPKQILLVEPDSLIGASLAMALKSAGYLPTIVTTAQDAVTVADKNTPDLVILELQLVSHSGIEFLYEFRSYPDWANVPAIIYSSVPPVEFAASQQGMGEELKVSSYLYKPNTSFAELIRVVNQLLPKQSAVIADAAA